jgi:hypothetical protein
MLALDRENCHRAEPGFARPRSGLSALADQWKGSGEAGRFPELPPGAAQYLASSVEGGGR